MSNNAIEIIERIKEKWQSLAVVQQAPPKLSTELLSEIIKNYSSPGRVYHNLTHLAQLFEREQEYGDRLSDREVVKLAIFYHDIIYVAGQPGNEESSAEKAVESMALLGVDQIRIKKVHEYILCTRDHSAVVTGDTDLQYFLDFDMAILASGRKEYECYVQNIRKEYASVPAFLFNAGRESFLRKLLTLPHIYLTREFQALEELARENIKRELTQL